MLRSHRRFWAVLLWAMLATPLAVMLLAPATATVDRREMRALAEWPTWPDGRKGWKHLPRQIDQYLADHFGLREPMLLAQALVAQRLLRNGNDAVLVGPDGWLFYRFSNTLQQSAGLLVRERRIAATADTLAQMARALEARGSRFLVAVPPSSSTIYDAHLPAWARRHGRRTEYDLLLEALAARGVEAIDLRPALQTAAREEQVYHRHDTHWNKLGALVAFNELVAATGRPDWRLDPSAMLVAATRQGGDLARMLGIDAVVTEPAPVLRNPQPDRDVPDTERQAPVQLNTAQAGPSILVVGDSFTRIYFPPMVLAHTGRYAWTHHEGCGLDWRWVERVAPDEVWWMPTERILLCKPGVAPAGLHPPVAAALTPSALPPAPAPPPSLP
jgi:hypothetical protein